jgi:hypothetical protein
MAVKKRYQNPVIGDQLELQLFIYNGNAPADVLEIYKVEIFGVKPNGNPNLPADRFLVQTIDPEDVTKLETGVYQTTINLQIPEYQVGQFVDVWSVNTIVNEGTQTIDNGFIVYPDLWYSAPIPMVYDFSFTFRPNRMRKGAIQYLICNITPNVPTGSDLMRYYENLAIAGNALLTLTRISGPCLPVEPELRVEMEDRPPDYKELLQSYYKIDTNDLSVGVYNATFKLEIGNNVYISENMAFQVFE